MNASQTNDDSETRIGLKISRTSMVLICAFVVLCAGAWFSATAWTVPAALAWHLLHGDYATFDGQTIRVPWDMWADSPTPQELTITRQAPDNPVLGSPSGTVLLSRTRSAAPINMESDYARLSHIAKQPPPGYRFQGEHQFLSSRGMGFCWESDSIIGSYVSISCAFDQDTLDASYAGSSVYRDRFYAIVAQVSDSSAGR